MEVAVLGSGNGGCAVAFDCATHGHDVRLFDFEEFPENIRSIQRKGGIWAEGGLEGFAPIAYAGHDAGKAMDGAEVIFVVGPAYSTRPIAKVCRAYLQKRQTIVVCPGSCMGSVEFKNVAGLSMRDQDIIVAETSTLPYAVRIVEPGKIRVFLKLRGGLILAAVPARATGSVLDTIGDLYPAISEAKNVLHTSLENDNPVIHPAVTLLNAALIERTGGDFLFYEEGITPTVGRLIEAVDRERIAIGRKMNIDLLPDPELGCIQGYMKEPTYDKGFSEAPGFRGIKAQRSLDHRYFNEDVGYGLVFMHSLGEQVGVDTPYISALIRVASLLVGRDYLGEAKRTMKSLGLSGNTIEELERLLT